MRIRDGFIVYALIALSASAGMQANVLADPHAAKNIDAYVRAVLEKNGMAPARPCTDAVFLRRVYLDVIGTLPTAEEVKDFLRDTRVDKRARRIDALLARDEFADYWAMKWCDLLRVKAEFPINLWPNAVQAYYRWIHNAVKTNMPYDEFARALLTSSGSNFRDPPVNFYRAVQRREPSAIAAAVALTFMGTRLETWPETQRANLEAFFSRIAFKGTDEWKEEIVYLDPSVTEPLDAVFPDGLSIRIPPDADPRGLFASWLITPENPWFTRNIANRVWSWLMGRGIIHEPDDIRPDNLPVNPELLSYLEQELIRGGYDLKRLFRLILNSSTYQQSSITSAPVREAEALFACYPIQALEAEVLSDALCAIFGPGESYSSMIPEPFTFIPDYHRTITLADGSITTSFLETFGRPARDTGLESERNSQVTAAQRLHLLNSSDVQKRISRGKLWQYVQNSRGKDGPMWAMRKIYLDILSRFPRQEEVEIIRRHMQSGDITPQQVFEDLVWALINSKEFLYRH